MNNQITRHGVFLQLFDRGILITGKSGIGKSELALALVNRHHRLIADDTVLIERLNANTLIGSCPEILADFLEVRGLGLLNIRRMFGETALMASHKLHLIINLELAEDSELRGHERLAVDYQMETVDGIDIPKISIPIALGRNLAILVEASVRQLILKAEGYDAFADFNQRHEAAIARNAIS
jgi:HPr kinase/phosphorylase